MDYLGHELLNGRYMKYSWYEIYRSILALQRIKVKVAIIMLFNLLAFQQSVLKLSSFKYFFTPHQVYNKILVIFICFSWKVSRSQTNLNWNSYSYRHILNKCYYNIIHTQLSHLMQNERRQHWWQNWWECFSHAYPEKFSHIT